MFDNYANLLQRSTAAVMGETISYERRGVGVVEDIKATRGRQLSRVNSDFNTLLVKGDADFIVVASDLQISDVTFLPVRGDEIITSKGEIFEVWPSSPSENCYELSDHAGNNFRIHTRRTNG